MLKLKYLTRISLIAFITFMAVSVPMKVKAQDDMPNDSETIIPPTSGGATPPTIIDESDSNTVPDVEEYDG